jgi:hypothetical protein
VEARGIWASIIRINEKNGSSSKMIQALLHLWGDYILQNHWMATKKVLNTPEGWLACWIHCLLYAWPFWIFLDISVVAILVIFSTHFLIDKFRLAKYLQMVRNGYFKGNGTPESAPLWLSTWLMFITDNILHVTINFIAISYL